MQEHAPACCAATRTMPPHRTRRRCYIAPAAAPKGPLMAVSSFSSRYQCAVAPVGDPLALGCGENRLSVHWPHAGQPAPVCTRGPKGRGRRRGAAASRLRMAPASPRAGPGPILQAQRCPQVPTGSLRPMPVAGASPGEPTRDSDCPKSSEGQVASRVSCGWSRDQPQLTREAACS